MAIPLKWSTLDQAAEWLSGKTSEQWGAERIIDFSIDQCKPDDVVEDHKYPSYLLSIIPDTMRTLLTWVALPKEDGVQNRGYVCKNIKNEGIEKTGTYLFRENLEELKISGKSELLYVSSDEPYANEGKADPVIVYCVLKPLMWSYGDPLDIPLLPIIKISYKTIGIRDKELRQLLSDYLASPKQERSKNSTNRQPSGTNKLRSDQMDKIKFKEIAVRLWEEKSEMNIEEIKNHPDVKYYKEKYRGKNTLRDWASDVDPRKGEKRGRPSKQVKNTRS
ncbi:hypothetical protein SAMN05421690_102828 [Nitrosomonas sp. Nm51]|uniref:hypothetical protein n=1 Tax=Nitrosomonas sp. Nm51 TaxID=133720 RepID=UPI0008B00629|nr:hypothetical protein [Nitrosomonas sp. Nm51]SER46160.1 hypothetical protein SAMN05421690_102828 [Nitrosomonas sp. Nm51]